MKWVNFKKGQARYLDEAANVRLALKKHRQWLITLSLITIIALFAVIHVASERSTVLVPYGLTKQASVSGHHGSSTYLTTLALADAETFLTIDPDTVEQSSARFLSRVHPSFYPETQQQLLAREREVKTNNLSQAFYPAEFHLLDHRDTVEIKGRLSRFSSGQSLGNKTVRARVTYRWVNGLAYINAWDVANEK